MLDHPYVVRIDISGRPGWLATVSALDAALGIAFPRTANPACAARFTEREAVARADAYSRRADVSQATVELAGTEHGKLLVRAD